MSLEFSHIAHAYAEVAALHDISFTAPTGQITCLLGSSGCGKSTLLNLAAGLLPVQQGCISVAGEILAEPGVNPAPEDRPVGLVFQDGALFPHMSIAKNVGFGLPSGERGIVGAWLEKVGLAGLGDRYPHELSGGQQQRAALARAMAPGPDVLLMDEPFASVDIVLRRRLRRDCRMLLKERGTTTVLVTHDPEEALDIGDWIAVMDAGRIVQFGTPEDLHERPVAASVGAIFRGAQIVSAEREGDWLKTAFGMWPVSCLAGSAPDASRLELLIYAERVACLPDAKGLQVRDIHSLGSISRALLVNEAGEEITAETTAVVDSELRYAPSPQQGSVLAFAAGNATDLPVDKSE